ncbi:MAG: site-specific integrase [Chitinophagaceae bacterium]
MEITFKFIIDKIHPKKDFTLPVRLRLYQERNYKQHSLGFSILEKDWNEQLQQVLSANENHLAYNAKISSIRSKVQKFLLFNEDRESCLTLDEVLKHISRKESKIAAKPKPDIFIYGKQHIAKLQAAGNIGNSIAYSCAINKLKSYTGKDKLEFEAITYKFLEDFNTSMLADGMKINGVSNYLRTIRALFNKAIKDGTLEARFYPFTGFKIRNEKTISRALTLPEMAKIASLKLSENTPVWHQRNLFLLSYCFIGINLADLLTLTKENIIDGRIIFRRKKTHKVYSIWVQEKAKEIFRYYVTALPENNKEFLLPFVKQKNNPIQLKKDIQQATKNCNDYLEKLAKLCKIEKPVTSYYARYSWANIARALGYSKDLIAEALGHEYGNRVTGIYLDNYDNATLDNMNERVIKAVFEG